MFAFAVVAYEGDIVAIAVVRGVPGFEGILESVVRDDQACVQLYIKWIGNACTITNSSCVGAIFAANDVRPPCDSITFIAFFTSSELMPVSGLSSAAYLFVFCKLLGVEVADDFV